MLHPFHPFHQLLLHSTVKKPHQRPMHSPLPCALGSTWRYGTVLGSPPSSRESLGKACHDQWLGRTFNAELRRWRHAASWKQQNKQRTAHHKKGHKHVFVSDLPSFQVISEPSWLLAFLIHDTNADDSNINRIRHK